MERITEVIKQQGITDSKFASTIGIQKQLFSNWKSLSQEIPDKYLVRIVQQFPNIDARWLITGEGTIDGEILAAKEEQEKFKKKQEEFKKSYNEIIELMKKQLEDKERIIQDKQQIIQMKDEIIKLLEKR